MTIKKQLEEAGIYNGFIIAECIADIEPEKNMLSDNEVHVAKLLCELLELDESLEADPSQIAKAIVRGEDELLKICSYLRDFGFTVDETREMLRENSFMLTASLKTMKDICTFLKDKGLKRDTVKSVLCDAVNLGLSEVKLRCETALKYFGEDTFESLAQGFLLYSYRTAPVECIEYAVKKCGAEKAEKLFSENEMLLYWFKDKAERQNPFQTQHAHALDLIEKATG